MTESLWIRLCAFAVERQLSYGIGVDHVSRGVVVHVGRAMGRGPTTNEAINRCADDLAIEGWIDDRGGPAT